MINVEIDKSTRDMTIKVDSDFLKFFRKKYQREVDGDAGCKGWLWLERNLIRKINRNVGFKTRLYWVRPEKIGALVSDTAPIFSNKYFFMSGVWFDEQYAIRSFVEDLFEKGETTFKFYSFSNLPKEGNDLGSVYNLD